MLKGWLENKEATLKPLAKVPLKAEDISRNLETQKVNLTLVFIEYWSKSNISDQDPCESWRLSSWRL